MEIDKNKKYGHNDIFMYCVLILLLKDYDITYIFDKI